MLKKLFISIGILRSRFRSFIRHEEGSVAVEMGISSVFFVMLISGMASFGSLFFIQGNMADAARDTARRVALGQITPEQANDFVQDRLVNWGMTYTVTATNDGTDATVQISVPTADAAIIDYMGMFSGNLRASVTMPVES